MGWFIIPGLGIYNSFLLGFCSVRETLWMLLSVCLCEPLSALKIGGVSFWLSVKGGVDC